MKDLRFQKASIIFFSLFVPLLNFQAINSLKNHKAVYKDFHIYRDTIPGTKISFDMIPVSGGSFLMGSPTGEKGRREDEGPLHLVQLDSFWIAKNEITWDEYELFVYPELEKEHRRISGVDSESKELDAVTRPTPPYEDMSFGMGKPGYPAVNMTQYAALMYCKWLTAKTGYFYRLPTEAEWEYACRAGSKTSYSFGDDLGQLHEYAWYEKNSAEKYHKVGTKKSNNWGINDLHGNVAEWTLDQYIPDFYSLSKATTVVNPWAVPSKLYPRVVRGGSWMDGAENLRSASRMASVPAWKQRDPQIPKSDWWNTDASFVGFRIVRPVKTPSPQEIEKYFAAPLKDY